MTTNLTRPGFAYNDDSRAAVHLHPQPSAIRLGAAGVIFADGGQRVWPVDVVVSGPVVDTFVDAEGRWSAANGVVNDDFFNRTWQTIHTHLSALHPPMGTRLGFLLEVWRKVYTGDAVEEMAELPCGVQYAVAVTDMATAEAPPLIHAMSSAVIVATPVPEDRRAVYLISARPDSVPDKPKTEMLHVWPVVHNGQPALYASLYYGLDMRDLYERLVPMNCVVEAAPNCDIGVDHWGQWMPGRVVNGKATAGLALFNTIMQAFVALFASGRSSDTLLVADVVREDMFNVRLRSWDASYVDVEDDVGYGWHPLYTL